MRWILAVVVLLAVGVVVVDDLGTHRELGDTRAERDIARRDQRRVQQRLRALRAEGEERSLVDIDGAIAEEITRQQSERAGIDRDRLPLIALPAGARACTADDVVLLSPQLDFLRFGRRTPGSCALLDWPGVEGRQPDGTWIPVPVQYVDSHSYTDGPPWTGLFDQRGNAAVLGIYVEPIDQALGGCRTGATTRRHFDAVRLVLASAAKRLDLPGVSLDVGPCRPSVRLWSYDVGGEG